MAPTTLDPNLDREVANWRRFWSTHGDDAGALDTNLSPAVKTQIKIDSLLASEPIRSLIQRAQLHEPAIRDIETNTLILVPPLHDPMAQLHKELRGRFPAAKYDTIVCVPWVRMGGADLVAGLAATALRTLRPRERLLLLRVDQPHFERPDWLPDDIDVVHVSDILQSVNDYNAERLLYAMFLGLQPKRVVNVNSRLCWSTFSRFGQRLSDEMHLYAYLFCWDQTSMGSRAGYPSLYPHTGSFLSATLTDTHYLRNELISMYRSPAALQDRIVPIYSPARERAPACSAAVSGVQSRDKRARPLILWAGRLDRQKRFDILLEIARRMPHVDFLCWGAAVLDAPPDFGNLPSNVTIRSPFKSFDELPLSEADAWLFTSAWEGMPTTLIELAVLGMPIVASAVGGVPELISEETGWPVAPFDDVDLYVTTLEEVIGSPAERIARANQLQTLATAQHSDESYNAAWNGLLTRENSWSNDPGLSGANRTSRGPAGRPVDSELRGGHLRSPSEGLVRRVVIGS